MKYWDSSAIVPLYVEETGTHLVREWLAQDPLVVTWAMTRLEVAAAVERLARSGTISAADRRRLHDRFDRFGATWSEVTDVLGTRSRGMSLLARHTLRAADAAQLGAAWVASDAEPSSIDFVCLDRTLAATAEREGFRVLTWPG